MSEDAFDRIEFGRRIQAARAYAGLTTTDLAAALEISESSLKRLEYGQGKRPLTSYRIQGLIDQLAEHTEMPSGFFTANLNELSPDLQPAEDRLASLEQTLAGMVLPALRETVVVGRKEHEQIQATMRELARRVAHIDARLANANIQPRKER